MGTAAMKHPLLLHSQVLKIKLPTLSLLPCKYGRPAKGMWLLFGVVLHNWIYQFFLPSTSILSFSMPPKLPLLAHLSLLLLKPPRQLHLSIWKPLVGTIFCLFLENRNQSISEEYCGLCNIYFFPLKCSLGLKSLLCSSVLILFPLGFF